MKNMFEIKIWNTGAGYCPEGQLVAAACLHDNDGIKGVYLVDLSRGLDYFYPGLEEVDPMVVMYRYNQNMGEHFRHDSSGELRTLMESLISSCYTGGVWQGRDGVLVEIATITINKDVLCSNGAGIKIY